MHYLKNNLLDANMDNNDDSLTYEDRLRLHLQMQATVPRVRGRCIQGERCNGPNLELCVQHRGCLGCRGILHMICVDPPPEDEQSYKCLRCQNANTGSGSGPVNGNGENMSPCVPIAGEKVRDAVSPTRQSLPASVRILNVSDNNQSTPPSSQKKKKDFKKKKPSVTNRIKKDCRVSITRQQLFQICKNDSQRGSLVLHVANNFRYYGTVIGGSSTSGYDVRFDVLPYDDNVINKVRRQRLTVLTTGEVEAPLPHQEPPPLQKDTAAAANKEDDTNLDVISPDSLKGKSQEEIASLVSCEMVAEGQQGSEEIKINWKILKDGEYIELEPATMPIDKRQTEESDEGNSTNTIDWQGKRLHEIFFENFLPDIRGHAKLIDKYHSSSRSSMHHTYIHDGIKFHDEDANDPDWIVKECYLLIIAAVGETERGIEGLWRQGGGPLAGRRDFPNFGQYVPVNYFRCFKAAAPYCWSPERYWYQDTRDGVWEMFMPCLRAYNERRHQLFQGRCKLFIVDESMSGWRPKTSKLGGLPNYTYEPRKPVPLGTMLRNSADCITGCLAFQDVVSCPEAQESKKYFGNNSHLPTQEPIKAHTAEVLRQVEGARVPPGGWVGGDSWFGSVATAVEVYKRFNVHSTWIIKTNTNFFPMSYLKAVLMARYPSHPAGHWVTMHTEIAGVPLMAVAYAWSQRGVSYFLSTCGSTKRSQIEYMSRFEDEFGNTSFKVLSRPKVCHFLYEYLPIIDEHNRQRQSFCALEKCWPTSNCWFRLLTTIVGMSLVDMHRMHRYAVSGRSIACSSGMDESPDRANLCTVINFCNRVSGGLTKRLGLPTTFRNMACRARGGEHLLLGGPIVATDSSGGNSIWWERIPNHNGSIHSCVTELQIEKHGRSTGTAVQRHCWVCRKYILPHGKPKYVKTSFQCSDCKRPICINEDRSCKELGRMMSCRDEHRFGNCPATGCIEINRFPTEKHFPENYKQVLKPLLGGANNVSTGGQCPSSSDKDEECDYDETKSDGEDDHKSSSSSSLSSSASSVPIPRRTQVQRVRPPAGATLSGLERRTTRAQARGMATRERARKRRRY